jgi:Fic family protein
LAELSRFASRSVRGFESRYLRICLRAVNEAERFYERFWDAVAGLALNGRQRPVLNLLLDGFEGKLTTSRYAKLARCSQDTALRDIVLLVECGVLVRSPGGGRSTSYALAAAPR